MGVEKFASGFKVRRHEAALAIPYGRNKWWNKACLELLS